MYRIMLIDDEPWALRGLKEIIDWGKYGFSDLLTFSDPKKALEEITRCCPDVICTDVCMPGMSGLELVEQVRRNGQNPMVVIVSAYAEFEYAKRAMDIGACSYILKPLDEEQIKALAEDLADKLGKSRSVALSKLMQSMVIRALTMEKARQEAPISQIGQMLQAPYRVVATAAEPEGAGGTWFPVYSDLTMAIVPGDMELPTGIALGVSTAASGSESLRRSIREALIAYFSLRFHEKTKGTYYYHSTGKSKIRLDNGVMRAIREENPVRAHKLLQAAKKTATDECVQIDELTSFYNFVLRGLYEISMKQDVRENLREFTGCFEMFGVLHTCGRLFDNLTILIDDCTRSTAAEQEPYNSALRVVHFVDSHFAEPITLEQMSDQFNISLSHLCRQFKRITGMPFTEYLMKIRIDQACYSLRYTDQPVSKVGESVGYQDYFYFTKVFKKNKGISPAAYRKAARDEE